MSDLAATALLFTVFLLMLVGGFLLFRASKKSAATAKGAEDDVTIAPHRLARIRGEPAPVNASKPQEEAE